MRRRPPISPSKNWDAVQEQGLSISRLGCSAKALRAGDLAGLHAAGADVGLADVALLVADRDLLHVRTEHAVGHAMRVADATARRGRLTANFANLRHSSHSIMLGSIPHLRMQDRLMTKKPIYYSTSARVATSNFHKENRHPWKAALHAPDGIDHAVAAMGLGGSDTDVFGVEGAHNAGNSALC